MDFSVPFILFIVAAVAFMLSVLLVPSDKNIRELEYEPKRPAGGLSLMRFNGFGNSFSGNFRKARLNSVVTHVAYNCLHIFYIPVLPFEAYRVSREKDGKTYKVYGQEKMRAREAFSIIFRSVATVCVILGIIFLVINYTDGHR